MFPNSYYYYIKLSVSVYTSSLSIVLLAVHHNMKGHIFSGQHERKHTEHVFRLSGLYRTLCDRNNKSSPGTPEAFFCSALGLSPSPNHRFAFLWETQLGTRKQCELLLSPPATRGIVRSEKQMLIGMWEQQESPGIMKDCVQCRAFERTNVHLILRGPDPSLRCTVLFLSPCSEHRCHRLPLFYQPQHVPS